MSTYVSDCVNYYSLPEGMMPAEGASYTDPGTACSSGCPLSVANNYALGGNCSSAPDSFTVNPSELGYISDCTNIYVDSNLQSAYGESGSAAAACGACGSFNNPMSALYSQVGQCTNPQLLNIVTDVISDGQNWYYTTNPILQSQKNNNNPKQACKNPLRIPHDPNATLVNSCSSAPPPPQFNYGGPSGSEEANSGSVQSMINADITPSQENFTLFESGNKTISVIIILLVIIVLGVGGYFLYRHMGTKSKFRCY